MFTNRSRDYFFIAFDLFVGVERSEASHHLIDEYAQRPPIHGLRVTLHREIEADLSLELLVNIVIFLKTVIQF